MSNPYLRAFIVNVILFGAAALRLLQQMGTKWSERHSFAACILGAVCLISAGIVGTLARRSSERWPWLKVIMVSIVCGIVTMVLILAIEKALHRT